MAFTQLILLLTLAGPCASLTTSRNPEDVAFKVAEKAVAQSGFFKPDMYGSALLLQSLWEATAAFPDAIDYRAVLGKHLDEFSLQKGTSAYEVLHNQPVGVWDSAIGDRRGLFPLAYFERAVYFRTHCSTPATYDNATDVRIATGAARKYIMPWPKLLPEDGTIARFVGGELGPKTSNTSRYIWGDDMFMGLTLVSRIATYVAGHEWEHALEWAAEQLLQITSYLADDATGSKGLYWHGFDAATGRHSCCKWGRANGWSMMAKVEILRAMAAVQKRRPGAINATRFARVKAALVTHATALAEVQAPDGRWHQVLDKPQTYLETSITAMNVFAMATALRMGWLEVEPFNATVARAWQGLASTVQKDGTVNGISSGAGIKANVSEYAAVGTNYSNSLNGGLGSVLRAAAAVQLLDIYGPGAGDGESEA